MPRILRGCVMIALLSLLSACNQYQDNSLATDAKEDICPPGCAASLKADDGQVSIKIMNGNIVLQPGETRADIGGDCYPSLYPKNVIVVKVFSANNTSYAVQYYGVNASSGSTVMCKSGRFNITVDMSTLARNTNYTVQASLLAYDSSGATHTNVSNGISYVNVALVQ